MRTRILPRDDWYRLPEAADLSKVSDQLPENAVVIVIEDDGGAILACWSLIRYWQAEGLWIAEERRASGAVGRRLLSALKAEVEKLGSPVILTATAKNDGPTKGLLEKAGATPVPLDLYRWPIVGEGELCQQP